MKNTETNKISPPSVEKLFVCYENRVYFFLSLLLTLIAVSTIWLVRFPPLQDFPYHLVRLHMLLNYESVGLGIADLVTVSLFPTPYILVDYLSLIFGQVFSVLVAGKIVLSLYIILMACSFFYAGNAFHGKYTPASLLGFVFVFNYFFSMGLLSFVFSIPFFLFALGYWFKHRNGFTFWQLICLALLIGGVYLSHPFTFCFLMLVLIFLSFYFCRDNPRIFLGLASFLPSLLLLVWVLMRDLPKSEVDQYIAFFIQNPLGKIARIFGDNLPHFASYKPKYESILLAIAGVMIIASSFILLVARNKKLLKGLVLSALLLVAAYIALPDDLLLPNLSLVANRTLIFAVLILSLLVIVPRRPLYRAGFALCVSGLAAAQIGLTYVSYKKINVEYDDLYTALHHAPANIRLAYWSNWGLAGRGNIYPMAHFNGYYYIERAGDKIPLLTAFAGPLRAIQFRDQSNRHRSMEEILSEGCGLAKDGGLVMLFSTHGSVPIAGRPQDFNCVMKWNSEHSAIYQAIVNAEHNPVSHTQTVTDLFSKDRYYKEGFTKDYDYVLIYGSKRDTEMLQSSQCYELKFGQNNAYLFKHLCS